LVVEGITAKKDDGIREEQQCCCKKFLRSMYTHKITEQDSSFTDDKYYCVVDGFGYPILENILYCPYCGNNLVDS
jgi:uncharacterized protein YbaR (Trm112 family)